MPSYKVHLVAKENKKGITFLGMYNINKDVNLATCNMLHHTFNNYGRAFKLK